ncbi:MULTISPECIES: hypothetical protein [unclassified Parafrankia]|uniref:hypothetical protein n=1 Tax=unclassified Parafrankia TaxID=2994368 RepID=UPI00135A0C45|nr:MULTISPECIES: hypothetical protein [unclassified Parafrankia]
MNAQAPGDLRVAGTASEHLGSLESDLFTSGALMGGLSSRAPECPTSRKMRPSATHMSPVQAFLDSGRSIVTVTTNPSRSARTFGW